MEEMTVLEMQRFLNQQYAEGKTELEAYRNQKRLKTKPVEPQRAEQSAQHNI